MFKYFIHEKLKSVQPLLLEYWLLIFYITAIAYLELAYRLLSFKSLSLDFVFPVLFSFSAGGIMFLISAVAWENINRIVAFLLTSLITTVFSIQFIYFCIFHVPMSIYSLSGTIDAMQFGGIFLSAVLRNIIRIMLLLLPNVFLFVMRGRLRYIHIKRPSIYFILTFCIASYMSSIICVNLTDKKIFPSTQYTTTTFRLSFRL